MTTTLDERHTIWRLRHLHDIGPKAISTIFSEINYSTIRRICSNWNPPETETDNNTFILPRDKTTVEQSGDQIIVNSQTTDITRIQKLEDLIAVCNIDLEQWTIERWVANTWENAMKGIDGKPILTTLYQVKAFLKPNPLARIKILIDAMREEIRAGAATYKAIPTPAFTNRSKNLLEISIPDMHFGMLALEEETSEEWNLNIAERTYRAAVTALLESASADPIDQILLPIGNDLLHIDNAYKKTFAGTDMDSVHNVKYLFKRVKNILRDAILDMVKVAPVRVITIPGNHDPTISYFLADALEDSLHNHPSITFDNSLKSRKYYSWGTVLLGFTHGDKEKHDRLPDLMSNEQSLACASAEWREWHIGHKHQQKTERFLPLATYNGTIVRTLPSLTAADAWHYGKGFIGGIRCAEAYLWNEDNALTATYNANLLRLL